MHAHTSPGTQFMITINQSGGSGVETTRSLHVRATMTNRTLEMKNKSSSSSSSSKSSKHIKSHELVDKEAIHRHDWVVRGTD